MAGVEWASSESTSKELYDTEVEMPERFAHNVSPFQWKTAGDKGTLWRVVVTPKL